MTLGACLLVWLAGLIPLPALAAETDLAAFLPGPAEVEGWRRTDRLDLARGQELFALIDGGAELFLRHGFRSYAATDYRGPGGSLISLELYEMEEPAGAGQVFRRKAGTEPARAGIAEEAVQGEYYLLFRTGRVLAVLVGPDPSEETRRGLTALARTTARRLEKGGRGGP